MKILVLGGTVFLGRHVVESALARGHSVTLFNRGRQNPNLFPNVEKLRGDRDGDLSALGGRRFDAVIDTSTYTPGQACRMADILDRRIEHYTFISSVSAYAGFPARRSYDETAPLAEGSDGYVPLKARSEEALEAAFPGRVAHLRPGLIAGPHDPTERFTYWPRRIAQGGEVLAPGRPERPIQLIDARDLADWCVRLSEGRRTGYFNALGPQSLLTMRQFLETLSKRLSSGTFEKADKLIHRYALPQFLESGKLRSWPAGRLQDEHPPGERARSRSPFRPCAQGESVLGLLGRHDRIVEAGPQRLERHNYHEAYLRGGGRR